jgi:hypothetical protein
MARQQFIPLQVISMSLLIFEVSLGSHKPMNPILERLDILALRQPLLKLLDSLDVFVAGWQDHHGNCYYVCICRVEE